MKQNNARKKRIAVISSAREISMFFELEAMACGCPVQVFSAPPQELSDFDLVILDTSAGICFSQNESCKIAALCIGTKKIDRDCFDYLWEWPLSIETVREAYEGTFAIKEESTKVNQEASLYFLSDSEDAVIYRNQTISLTHSEWLVLRLLADREKTPVSRTEISDLFEGTQGNIADVHICHLRKKLENPFGIRLIETVRGKGYALKAKSIYL